MHVCRRPGPWRPGHVSYEPATINETGSTPESDVTPGTHPETTSTSTPEPPLLTGTRAEILEYLKNATALVKVETCRETVIGTGFIVAQDKVYSYVVTNAHTVAPQLGSRKSIECVFRSGRKDEFAVLGDLRGIDPTSSLAVIAVRTDRLPRPVPTSGNVEVHETLATMVLGYPAPAAQTPSERNPDIAVTQCAISSISRDEHDSMSILHLDTQLSLDSLGGPVVTDKGQLIGISVPDPEGTQSGLALPVRDIQSAINGRVAAFELKKVTHDTQKHVYHVTPSVMDPLSNIDSAVVLTGRAGLLDSATARSDGTWKRLTEDMQESPLHLLDGSLVIFPLSDEDEDPVFQIEWTLKDGTKRYSEPFCYDRNTRPTASIRRPASQSASNNPPTTVSASAPGSPFTIVTLPSAKADFALNPRTGDVATVDPLKNQAVLYKAESGFQPEEEPPTVSLGQSRSPCLTGNSETQNCSLPCVRRTLTCMSSTLTRSS